MNAVRAADLVQSFGVNTHLGYAGDTPYGNAQQVKSELSYLGISRVRDGIYGSYFLPSIDLLMTAGIKFDFYLGTSGSLSVSNQLKQIDLRASGVASIEGPNEVNFWPVKWAGKTGAAAAVALQKYIYTTVHTDPVLNGAGKTTPVYSFTLGSVGPAGYASYGNLSASADYSSAHVYFGHGKAPSDVLSSALSTASTDTPGLPSIITEAGYPTLLKDPSGQGVSTKVQASYTLDLLLDAYVSGVSQTFLYELIDEKADPSGTKSQRHYGLFNNDGTPKPVAAALHNMTTLLADTGGAATTFSAGSANPTVSGLPPSGHTMLLQKSDGTYILAVWAEPDIWSASKRSDISVAATPVTVEFGAAESSVTVYDPLSGLSPIQTLGTTSSVKVSVTDHPILIFFSDPPPPPVALTVGDKQCIQEGPGNYIATGPGNGATVTLGDGNQTVNIGGWANIITVGTGTSVIAAGSGYETVRAVGGNVTISAHGNGNLFDAGPGTNMLTFDTGSVHNTAVLNGASEGVTTIKGFNLKGYDKLDLTRTLAGTKVAADFSDVTKYISARTSGADTILYVGPTGGSGGAPTAFARLVDVTTSVPKLLSNHVLQ